MISTTSASSSSASLPLSPLSDRNRALPALPSPSPSASSLSSSGSSSCVSLAAADDENVTITANRVSRLSLKSRQKSQEDLRLLAVSAHITELTYSISDIEARIFEIQELRHKSQSGDASSTSRVIDQSLAQLDERLQFVQDGVAAVAEAIGPVVESHKNSSSGKNGALGEEELLLRQHATMLSEWEAVQKESQILREELREDKWLTVFRTVTEQADGMMTSLEKAVNRCQDFISRLRRHGHDDALSRSSSSVSSLNSDSSPSFDQFNSLLDSYEAKKKHYMPATAKVLSIIDKGVQERVTKNGECLRRHAESTQRWQHLKERIARTDRDMESVRKIFLSEDVTPSESAISSTSGGIVGQTKSAFLTTSPPNGSQSGKSKGGSTISRATSPFRKLARKIARGAKSPVSSVPATPVVPKLDPIILQTPSSEPTRTLRHRSSLFNLLSKESSPLTPDRSGHKHSQSLTPDSSPLRGGAGDISINQTLKINRPKWNISTRVEDDGTRNGTVKSTPRRVSHAGTFRFSDDQSPLASTTYKRSVSRSSMASSRPWSPVTSSVSTAQSSINQPLTSLYRPPSRAQTPGLSAISPRPRARTPSHIPRPSLTGGSHFRSVSGSVSPSHSGSSSRDEEGTGSLLQRALSPTGRQTPSGHPPRPPSRSMIPVPVPDVQVQSASRPSSSMSNYRLESSMSFRGSAMRTQTPEAFRATPRPSAITPRLPPSSFKDSSMPRTPGRPPSRSGAATPSLDGKPVHAYIPSNPRDPLDAEVAAIVNHMAHGLLIERIDPPLRGVPKDGEEIRAQYAFSNMLGRKIVNCKLTTMTRSGRDHATTTRKVMCRVGGGWQDLPVYIMNRQAAI